MSGQGQLTGKATIRVDGNVLAAENGATLNPGGVNRPPERHGGDTFYVEEEVPPSLEASVLHTKDTDIMALSNITGATVHFEADTGQQFIMRGAFVTEPAVLDASSGKVPLSMSARSVDKV